jgi:SAM-dependent methyltransferase
MSSEADRRRYGTAFDEIADEYHRHRPTYPDVLIDRACGVAGIEPGAPVLEVGCGTGQLTRSLLARGLRVTAVEPGVQLIARARAHLAAAGEVEFVNARFEDALPPSANFRAVFSASAIHWIDPDVSWRRAAHALVDGGTLALVSYFGLEDPRSAADQQVLRDAMARIAPELAAAWPTYRDLDGTLAGFAARRGNVSEAWAWLGSYEIARRDAATLFCEADIATMPMLLKHTGQELTALLSTMSFWAQLSPGQRDALAAEINARYQRLARPMRSSTVACLVTARRAPRT